MPFQELEEQKFFHGEVGIEVIVLIKGFKRATTLVWDGAEFRDATGEPYSVEKWMPFPTVDEK